MADWLDQFREDTDTVRDAFTRALRSRPETPQALALFVERQARIDPSPVAQRIVAAVGADWRGARACAACVIENEGSAGKQLSFGFANSGHAAKLKGQVQR